MNCRSIPDGPCPGFRPVSPGFCPPIVHRGLRTIGYRERLVRCSVAWIRQSARRCRVSRTQARDGSDRVPADAPVVRSSSERRPGPGSCSHTGSRRGTLRLASCRTPAGASVSPAFAATRAHTPNADCWRGRGLCLKVIGAPPEQLVGPAGPRPPTLSAVSRVVRLGRACPHRSKRRLDPGQILSKRLIFERAVWEHGDVTRVAVSGCAPARRAPVPVDRLASRG
jgi:hypothetical protein